MTVTPRPVAAIVETNVLGAVAHHAECLIGGCPWRSRRLDARKDGEPDGRVLAAARRHSDEPHGEDR